MRVLVFGSRGWIGSCFIKHTQHQIIQAKSRPENYEECCSEIESVSPDTVVSFIGRTHGRDGNGQLVSSIDYLELPGKLTENMRDNFVAPVHLAQICYDRSIHYMYLGTGCIYTYTDEKYVFSEDDLPNFFGSSYSIIKGATDREMRRFSNTLQLRIRMPISKYSHPRNLLDKLVYYKNICSAPNSMTVLDDMWIVIDAMITEKTTGTYNLANPGIVEHTWILEKYKTLVDPGHTWNVITYKEQMTLIKSHRSNNELSTEKLENFCNTRMIPLPGIHESIVNCLKNYVSHN